MQQSEKTQVDEAFATLSRMRSVQVRFQVRWTRLDDLDPSAEHALKDALQAIWEAWAQQHGVTEAEIRGPDVTAAKLDYIPLTEDVS